MRAKNRVFGHLSLLLVLGMTALSARGYDLWQAYQEALQNDPTYLSATAQTEIARAQKKQARSVMMPTITLDGEARNTSNSVLSSSANICGDTRCYPANWKISLNQSLFALDKITAYRQINIGEQIGDLQLAQARQDLIARVVQAYFGAWLNNNAAKIAKAQMDAAEQQFNAARKNFEVGNTTVIDQQEAETAWQNALANSINAQSNADNAKTVLETMVGHSINEPLAVLKDPTRLKMPMPQSLNDWLTRAQSDNYAIKMARLGYRVKELDVARHHQQHLPTVSLTAYRQWNSINFRQSDDARYTVNSIGLTLSMPLFDGGLISNQVAEAEAVKTQSFQTLRNTQMSVEQATRSAYNQAVSGLAGIAALEKASSNAGKAVASNQLGYKLGMRINIDVLNAQNTYAQTQNNLAQAQYNTIVGNVNLKSVISRLGDEDVRYINDLLVQPSADSGSVSK